MLRASIAYNGQEADLQGIADGAKAGDQGIVYGEKLTAFADAAVAGDPATLASARDALRDAAGSEALVDAAAVLGNFERMVRIADGTGIPLDEVVHTMSGDFREGLGIDSYRSRREVDAGPLARAFAPVLRRVASLGLGLAGRLTRRSD